MVVLMRNNKVYFYIIPCTYRTRHFCLYTSANALFEASVIGDPCILGLGDGTTLGPDTAVYHTYNQNGFYHIKLSLDNQGCTRIINLDSVEAYQPNSLFSPLTIGPFAIETVFFTSR